MVSHIHIRLFFLSQSTRLTDGQTDVDSKAVRMHWQSRGKNCVTKVVVVIALAAIDKQVLVNGHMI